MTRSRDEGGLDSAAEASLEVRAYEVLLDWLVQGKLRPGQFLPLSELARLLGMSRTPLRAAVGRLHAQGLVVYDPRLGFTIAVPSPAELFELFDLRLMCETHGLQRFFAEPGRELPPELSQLVADASEVAGQIADDPTKFALFAEQDARLHRAFVMLGESRRLLDFYDQLQLGILMLRLWGTATLTEERFRNAADEHLHILEAMQRGDADAALRLLESHIIRVRGSALDRLMRAGTLHSPSQRTRLLVHRTA